MRLRDHLSRMTHQLPNSAQHHGMFRLVLLDLLAFLGELLRHRGYLRLLRLECLHLRPIHHLGYLPQNVFGSTVAKGPAHSSSDVLQLKVVVLEVGHFRPDLMEGGFRKLKIGQVDVSPGLRG